MGRNLIGFFGSHGKAQGQKEGKQRRKRRPKKESMEKIIALLIPYYRNKKNCLIDWEKVAQTKGQKVKKT